MADVVREALIGGIKEKLLNTAGGLTREKAAEPTGCRGRGNRARQTTCTGLHLIRTSTGEVLTQVVTAHGMGGSGKSHAHSDRTHAFIMQVVHKLRPRPPLPLHFCSHGTLLAFAFIRQLSFT